MSAQQCPGKMIKYRKKKNTVKHSATLGSKLRRLRCVDFRLLSSYPAWPPRVSTLAGTVQMKGDKIQTLSKANNPFKQNRVIRLSGIVSRCFKTVWHLKQFSQCSETF
jgi:hypothetical protein